MRTGWGRIAERGYIPALWTERRWLGSYQVLKKWLSYRERDVLGRALTPGEVLCFAEMHARIAFRF